MIVLEQCTVYEKFRYCEKAKKFEKISPPFFKLLKQSGRFFSNLCGLLRISELYVIFKALLMNDP